MDLGIFDHLDRRDVPVADFYETACACSRSTTRRASTRTTWPSTTRRRSAWRPVPGIFLAAATQRTRRIRLGPCVYCLPLYDPLRLIEEVCMLDHLSRGPLRLRGGPRHRALRDGLLRPAPSRDRGDLPGDARDRPAGAHQRRARASRAEVHLSKGPHDPEAAPEAAPAALVRARPRGGRRVGGHQPRQRDHQPGGRAVARRSSTRYREVWQRKHGDAAHAEARHGPPRGGGAHRGRGDGARPAPPTRSWYANLTKLWRDFGAVPFRFAPDFDEARRAASPSRARPAQVREEIERQVAASGCTYMTCRPDVRRDERGGGGGHVDLFVAEVMPHRHRAGRARVTP